MDSILPSPYPEQRIAAFWSRVDRRGPDECWEWTASRYPTGYGYITIGGKKSYAHRVAYELTHGPIPGGLHICHRCDNPPCCNPAHLFAGTAKDNMQDRDRKGRSGRHTHPEAYALIGQKTAIKLRGRKRGYHENARGEDHGSAKLTEDKVRELRYLARQGWTGRQLSRHFGIAASTANDIIRRRTWRHVE